MHADLPACTSMIHAGLLQVNQALHTYLQKSRGQNDMPRSDMVEVAMSTAEVQLLLDARM
jgi:hypothetical protein